MSARSRKSHVTPAKSAAAKFSPRVDQRQSAAATSDVSHPTASSERQSMQGRRHWWRFALAAPAVVVAALLLTVLSPLGQRGVEATLRRQWRIQLERVPRDSLAAHLRRVAALGDNSLPVLVDQLAVDDVAARRAAQAVLSEQVDRWRESPPAEGSPRLARLLSLLAAAAEARPVDSRAWQATVAEQALHWPLDATARDARGAAAVDSGRWLADCERLLRSAAGLTPGHGPWHEALSWRQPERYDPPPAPPAEIRRPATEVVDGAFTRETSAEDESSAPAAPSTTNAESRGVAPPSTLPLELPGSRPLAPPEPMLPVVPAAGAPRGALPVGQPAMRRLEEMTSVELVQLLEHPDRPVAAAVEAELARRGSPPHEWPLWRRLGDADPEVRRAACQLVIRTPGIDAVDWLLRLSHDPVAEVRLEAAVQMSASNHPVLHRRVREMAALDPSSEVREQLRPLIGPVGGRR